LLSELLPSIGTSVNLTAESFSMVDGSKIWWCVMATLFVGLAGCGGREAYQVSGRAQYIDGSPITGGVRVVRFEPMQDSRAEVRKAASAYIDPDGSFELFTRRPGDGVIAGSYAVTFTVLDKPMDGRSLIPEKYNRIADTPFEIDVDDDRDDLLFELEKN
jgi:hypothetical protein